MTKSEREGRGVSVPPGFPRPGGQGEFRADDAASWSFMIAQFFYSNCRKQTNKTKKPTQSLVKPSWMETSSRFSFFCPSLSCRRASNWASHFAFSLLLTLISPQTSDLMSPLLLLSLQILWQCRSLVIGPTGAWSPTGRRRRVSGASTQSRSRLWTSSTIYLRGTAFAWASSAPKTSPSSCRWCGPKSVTASS